MDWPSDEDAFWHENYGSRFVPYWSRAVQDTPWWVYAGLGLLVAAVLVWGMCS